MLTLLVLFCAVCLLGGALGLVFRVFKWVFLLALGIGAVLLAAVFAVPLLILAPIVGILALLYFGASLLF